MAKYNVVIDSSIYRRNPTRDDLAFDALRALSKADVLKLHIPYIVLREFQTQQEEVHAKEIASARKGLEGVIRKRLIGEGSRTQVEALLASLETVGEAALAEVKSSMPSWAAELKADVHDLTLEDAKRALEAYFSGTDPLKAPKNREDIPDAFIFQDVHALSKKPTPLVVIVDDGKLAEAAKNLENTQVFDTLLTFIESAPIQSELKQLDAEALFEQARDQLRQLEDDQGVLAAFVRSNAGEKLTWKRLTDPSIPDDNNEAVVSMFGDVDEVEFDFDRMAEFGGGVLGLPFTFECEVSIIFYVFKSDYYLTDDHAYSISDHNNHYFEAEAETAVRATGMLRIELPAEYDKSKSLTDMEEDLELSIDEVVDISLVDDIG
jgi:hypothetical protein